MKKYYKIILTKVKDREKLRNALPPLTDKEVQDAADKLERMPEEELSEYDEELFDFKKKTIH